MAIPTLPTEVWFRISTHLALPELASMSQVSQTLHNVATDETHYQRLLVHPQPPSIIPSIAYRRLQALLYPPSSTNIHMPAHTDMLCIVEDTLILIDRATARLISFPNTQTANIEDLIGPPASPEGYLTNLVREQLTILPGARIAFLKGSNPVLLTVLDIKTWNMTRHVISGKRGAKLILGRMIQSYVYTAGNHGQWIMYDTDGERANLVDWRRGTVVRTVQSISKDVSPKWLMGTCLETNDLSVVGVVRQSEDPSTNEIHAKGFDDSQRTFRLPEYRKLLAVTRNADAQIYVVAVDPASGGLPMYLVYKTLSGSVQTQHGMFLSPSNPLINGNVIETRPPRLLSLTRPDTGNSSQQRFVVLRDDGNEQQIWTPICSANSTIWSKVTSDDGIAVMGAKQRNCVEVHRLRDLDKPIVISYNVAGDAREADPLHSLSVRGLANLCVLADHIIIATKANGEAVIFHFDRFCCKDGIYACSFMRTLQSFRFPNVGHTGLLG